MRRNLSPPDLAFLAPKGPLISVLDMLMLPAESTIYRVSTNGVVLGPTEVPNLGTLGGYWASAVAFANGQGSSIRILGVAPSEFLYMESGQFAGTHLFGFTAELPANKFVAEAHFGAIVEAVSIGQLGQYWDFGWGIGSIEQAGVKKVQLNVSGQAGGTAGANSNTLTTPVVANTTKMQVLWGWVGQNVYLEVIGIPEVTFNAGLASNLGTNSEWFPGDSVGRIDYIFARSTVPGSKAAMRSYIAAKLIEINAPPSDELLLLHMDGGNGSATFTDSSPTPHKLTPVGGAVQSNVQTKFGVSAVKFGPGSMTLNAKAVQGLRTDDFYIDMWIYALSYGSGPSGDYDGALIDNRHVNTGYAGYGWFFTTSGKLRWFSQASGGSIFDGPTTVPLNQWVHVAFSRQSGVCRMFINGAMEVGLANNLVDCVSDRWNLGRSTDGLIPFDGFIDEVRVQKGNAVHSSSFTPPVAPYGVFVPPAPQSPQSLLLHMDGGNGSSVFVDSSSDPPRAVTPVASVVQSNTQAKFGVSSARFTNGRLDIIGRPKFGTGDFCVDMWAYITSYVLVPLGDYGGCFADDRANTTSDPNSYLWCLNSSGKLRWFQGTIGTIYDGATTVPLGQWVHLAFTREFGICRMFINGVMESSPVVNNANCGSTLLGVGRAYDGGNIPFNGFIDEVRVVAGYAVYNSNFTPPVAPYGAFTPPPTDPQFLLLHMDGGNGSSVFVDSSVSPRPLQSLGVVQSNVQAKFGVSSARFTNSTRLNVNGRPSFRTGDFCIDVWVYALNYGPAPSGSHGSCVVDERTSGGSGFAWFLTTGGNVRLFDGGNHDGSTVVPLNQWVHLAFTRQAGLNRVFVNGVLDFTFSSAADLVSNIMAIGRVVNDAIPFDGFIDEVHVVKGSAVYVANFTPPVAPYA